ncbi:MAG TPA: hypothetical protein PKV56_15585 [Burkholderiaceae bacterium]|nr:hypothetical protein [Burkholderiaceae bacterium]
MENLFRFCDPHASFSKGSKGRRSRKVFTKWGESNLGIDAWKVGLKAYEQFSSACGKEATLADLKCFVTASLPTLEEFGSDFEELVRAKRIELIDYDSGKAIKSAPDWKSFSWNWQMRMMLQCIVAGLNAMGHGEKLEAIRSQFAVTALAELDDAVVASLDNDTAAVLSSVMNATWLMDQADAAGRVKEVATVMLGKLDSQRAAIRARVRHAKDPRRLARDFVYQCWLDWKAKPSQYPSAAAFARSMLDKEPDKLRSEVVITRWVRGWAKESK